MLALGCTDHGGTSDEQGTDSGASSDDADTSSSDTDTGGDDGTYSLANCEASVADGVADFYTQYFACADITSVAGGTQLWTSSLPPHLSA